VKYADNLVVLAKEKTVLLNVTDRLIEISRCSGMDINVEENVGNDNLQATICSTDYDRPQNRTWTIASVWVP
jgi:hypothetical protein